MVSLPTRVYYERRNPEAEACNTSKQGVRRYKSENGGQFQPTGSLETRGLNLGCQARRETIYVPTTKQGSRPPGNAQTCKACSPAGNNLGLGLVVKIYTQNLNYEMIKMGLGVPGVACCKRFFYS